MAERGLIQRWPTSGGALYGESVFVVGLVVNAIGRRVIGLRS